MNYILLKIIYKYADGGMSNFFLILLSIIKDKEKIINFHLINNFIYIYNFNNLYINQKA